MSMQTERGIIFSDVDGVWLDESKKFAFPNPQNLRILNEARKAGFRLILNSDTGAQTLASFADRLGFDTDLVIAENGGVIYSPQEKTSEYLSPFAPTFKPLRKRFEEVLISQAPEALVFLGDATRFIQETVTLPGFSGTFYAINGTRETSFGVYTRYVAKSGKMEVIDELTERTELMLAEILSTFPEGRVLSLRRYPIVGSCLVRDPNLRKSTAVERVINRRPSDLIYFMLGDTEADSMETLAPRVITCAVGNATPILKEVVIRTNGIQAPDNLVIDRGARYIISQIIERSR